VKIKICGIHELEDAFICVDEGADALGFIFYPRSPRFILPKRAKKIIDALPCFINTVGVFVNEKEEKVKEIAEFTGIDTLQFHGKESPSYCRRFRKNHKVMKSFFPKDESILPLIDKYSVDGVLLDIPFEDKKEFPKKVLKKSVLKNILRKVKFSVISGGLSPENIESVVRSFHPFAVDVARGVERLTTKKDKYLIREFARRARKAEREKV